MDKIYLRNLHIETIIGIHPHERITSQPVIVNLEIAVNIQKAAATDNIAHALDYAAIANRLTQFIEARQDQLLETLSEACAQMLLLEFDTTWLRLQIGKPNAIDNAEQAGIMIERSKIVEN